MSDCCNVSVISTRMETAGQSPRVSWAESPRGAATMSDVAVYQDKVRKLEERLGEEKKVTDGIQARLAEEMSRGESLRRQLQEVTLQNTTLGRSKEEAEVKVAQVTNNGWKCCAVYSRKEAFRSSMCGFKSLQGEA